MKSSLLPRRQKTTTTQRSPLRRWRVWSDLLGFDMIWSDLIESETHWLSINVIFLPVWCICIAVYWISMVGDVFVVCCLSKQFSYRINLSLKFNVTPVQHHFAQEILGIAGNLMWHNTSLETSMEELKTANTSRCQKWIRTITAAWHRYCSLKYVR